MENDTLENVSTIGRLLDEISWEGSTVKRYREGGIGFENVLTTETFQGLDFLPRKQFLGEVINQLNGGSEKTKQRLVNEIEDAGLEILPGNIYLIPSADSHMTALPVQPDGIISTSTTYSLIEAKRIRSSSFMPEQLSREYITVLREAKDKLPLLILVLGKEPPVSIQKNGRKSFKEGVLLHLKSVYDRTEDFPYDYDHIVERIDDVVSWITWDQISDIVVEQLGTYQSGDESINNSVKRVANSVIDSVKRHR